MNSKLDAIILCGGRGTRLAAVLNDVPKPLAPVLGRPFLDYLLAFLAASGAVRMAVLAVHHLADQFEEHYATHAAPLPLRIVREPEPLGTGGALVHALTATIGETVLCCNGDSLVGGDLAALVTAHWQLGAGITLALVAVPDTSRYGQVLCAEDGRVLRFTEKAPDAGAGLINAGVYVLDKWIFDSHKAGMLSMETDILPALVAKGVVYGVPMQGPFIDIGLPETYLAAADFLRGFSGLSPERRTAPPSRG